MTTNKPDGGPAFPAPGYVNQGMSKREYYAAHAPQRPDGWWPEGRMHQNVILPCEAQAAWAVKYADALIAELEKP